MLIFLNALLSADACTESMLILKAAWLHSGLLLYAQFIFFNRCFNILEEFLKETFEAKWKKKTLLAFS